MIILYLTCPPSHRPQAGPAFGIINLHECTGIEERARIGKNYVFSITLPKRDYVLMAESNATLHMWLTALRQVLEKKLITGDAPPELVRTVSEAIRKAPSEKQAGEASEAVSSPAETDPAPSAAGPEASPAEGSEGECLADPSGAAPAEEQQSAPAAGGSEPSRASSTLSAGRGRKLAGRPSKPPPPTPGSGGGGGTGVGAGGAGATGPGVQQPATAELEGGCQPDNGGVPGGSTTGGAASARVTREGDGRGEAPAAGETALGPAAQPASDETSADTRANSGGDADADASTDADVGTRVSAAPGTSADTGGGGGGGADADPSASADADAITDAGAGGGADADPSASASLDATTDAATDARADAGPSAETDADADSGGISPTNSTVVDFEAHLSPELTEPCSDEEGPPLLAGDVGEDDTNDDGAEGMASEDYLHIAANCPGVE